MTKNSEIITNMPWNDPMGDCCSAAWPSKASTAKLLECPAKSGAGPSSIRSRPWATGDWRAKGRSTGREPRGSGPRLLVEPAQAVEEEFLRRGAAALGEDAIGRCHEGELSLVQADETIGHVADVALGCLGRGGERHRAAHHAERPLAAFLAADEEQAGAPAVGKGSEEVGQGHPREIAPEHGTEARAVADQRVDGGQMEAPVIHSVCKPPDQRSYSPAAK